MKTLLSKYVSLALMALPAISAGQSISTNQTFATRNGMTFSNTSLDAYAGKILVVMLMTPWCPGCQSNASAVGDGILDHFNATARGNLRGKNNQGIEIDSVLLSTEPASNWDATNSSFATTNGYEQWGLDAQADRSSPRVLLGFYRGGFPNGVNSSNLYNWGEDRRRVVVLNMVNQSSTHSYREIIINQNSFDSSDSANAQSLINAIAPAPVVTPFSAWATGFSFPANMSGALSDPDNDGITNLLEFFHGTHPLQKDAHNPSPKLMRDGDQWKIVYQRARNIGGFTLVHRSTSNLTNWTPLASDLPQSVTRIGNVDEISVTLPATTNSSTYYQLSVTLNP